MVVEQHALAAEYEARGHALRGDAAAADRKLGEAQDLAENLTARQDRRSWLYWMTPDYLRNQAGITCAYLAADPSWHAHAVALLDKPTPRLQREPGHRRKISSTWHSRTCGLVIQNKRAARLLQRRSWYGSPDLYDAQSSSTESMLACDRWPGDPRAAERADTLAEGAVAALSKSRSITTAPVRITGRRSCRYTSSVVAVCLCPTRSAISSTTMPSSDISDTNVCRSSRGAQPGPSPAAFVILRNSRRTFAASSSVPTDEQNTSPCSCHAPPASSRSVAWSACSRTSAS